MWIHYERLHNHNKAKHNKTVCIFLGIYCKMARSTPKSSVSCLEHILNIVHKTDRIAMKPCQDHVNLFLHPSVRTNPRVSIVCVFLLISCEVVPMYRILSLWHWDPISVGTPCGLQGCWNGVPIIGTMENCTYLFAFLFLFRQACLHLWNFEAVTTWLQLRLLQW